MGKKIFFNDVHLMVKAMDNKDEPMFSEVENEPTPYGLGSASRPPDSKNNHVAMYVGVGVLVVVGALIGFFVLHRGGMPQTIPTSPRFTSPLVPTTTPNQSQASLAITIGVQRTKNGDQLVIRWTTLPNGTTEINIFYSPTQNGTYRLIGSVPVSSLTNGNGYLDIPDGYQGGYYYGVAVDNNGASTSSINIDSSSSGSGGDGSNGSIPPINNGNGSSSDSGAPSNGTTSTSSTPSENFLVQHVDEKIQISWQTLPAGTSRVVVSRSASSTGPWTAVLTETNIMTDGPYSVEVVDDTLGDPYYYEMDTYDQNGVIISSYDPILLQPL